jgi:hypothetical protein
MKRHLYAFIGLAILPGLSSIASAQERLTTVQSGNGVLGGSDRRDANGNYYDDFRFVLDAGQRVRVNAVRPAGSSLDPIVEVYAPGQSQYLDRNDDGGGFPNARLEFVAPRAGTYVIRVLSFGSTTGPYDISIEPLAAVAAAQNLSTVNNGRFDNSVPTVGGAHYRDYRVQLSAGQDIVLRMDSPTFDSVIRVYPAGGEGGQPLAENDDFGGTLNSGLLFRAPRSGAYTIRATELSHGDGAYTLRATILP